MIRQLIASVACASAALAQSAGPAPAVHALPGTLPHYRLDLSSGTLTRLDEGPSGSADAVGAVISYGNNCDSGLFTNNPGVEQVDWGVKSAGISTIVESFVFAYGTTTLDVSVGGPGASLDIAFYAGTTGSGTLGTVDARFSFTGLPGSRDGVGAGGGIIEVVPPSSFVLPDGPIGYGYCSFDALTGPVLVDASGPCSVNSIVNAWDEYACPATGGGSYLGTFAFPSPAPPVGSWYMEIREFDTAPVAAATTVNNGTGINPVLLSDGGVAPVLGEVWPAVIDNSSSGYSSSSALYTIGPIASPVFLAGGEVICNLLDPNGFVATSTVFAMGMNDHSALVVLDVSLLGLDITCQGLLAGGVPGYLLTNAIDLHLGL